MHVRVFLDWVKYSQMINEKSHNRLQSPTDSISAIKQYYNVNPSFSAPSLQMHWKQLP